MAYYVTLTAARSDAADPAAVLAVVKTATGDPSAVLVPLTGLTWRGKKATTWTAPEIAAAQNALETTAARDDDAIAIDQKTLKAIILGVWEAISAPLLTKVQLRTRIIAIYKALS